MTKILFLHRPLYCMNHEGAFCSLVSILVFILLYLPKAPRINKIRHKKWNVQEPEEENQGEHIFPLLSLGRIDCGVPNRSANQADSNIFPCAINTVSQGETTRVFMFDFFTGVFSSLEESLIISPEELYLMSTVHVINLFDIYR